MSDYRKVDTAEIAKMIRNDIKAAKKSSALPKSLKVSVKTSRFSGGSSIDLSIKSAEGIHNSEWIAHYVEDPNTFDPRLDRYTPEANELLKALEKIVNKYLYDNSDPMTDYFECNFYKHVQFDTSAEIADREAAEAEYKASKARS